MCKKGSHRIILKFPKGRILTFLANPKYIHVWYM